MIFRPYTEASETRHGATLFTAEGDLSLTTAAIRCHTLLFLLRSSPVTKPGSSGWHVHPVLTLNPLSFQPAQDVMSTTATWISSRNIENHQHHGFSSNPPHCNKVQWPALGRSTCRPRFWTMYEDDRSFISNVVLDDWGQQGS